MALTGKAWLQGWPVLRGVLPVRRAQLASDLLAGLTLAALGIPEVLGYAKIAGMPVVTGLYTLLIPMAAFAVLGSSRHLVVAADSATAAILAATLAGLATPGSPHYVQLAGLAALLTGALLLLARLARLGFLANFLSRTVLLGFLAGVGIAVAAGQLPDMLAIPHQGTGTIRMLAHTLADLGQARPATIAVSAAVIAVMVTARLITRRVPGALIAVIAAISVSYAADLARHGVAVLGSVPKGLPRLAAPSLSLHDARLLALSAGSMFVVVLAQSAATARAYALKYEELSDEDTDLSALGAANVTAAFCGSFVVNGSPTKTQIADGAGGRSQLTQLATSVVVLIVLLVATAPLAYLPTAALAAIVFLIAIQLIDVRGLRHILAVRPEEFAVALLTTAAVVVLGVQDGIVVAVIASTIDHLRHSYHPLSSVLVKSAAGHWHPAEVAPGARTADGLVVYRFGTSLYYANAARLMSDVAMLTGQGSPLRWLVLDCAAIGDVDVTAASVLLQLAEHLHARQVTFAVSSLLAPVRRQFGRYGLTGRAGPDAYYDTPGAALEAFHAAAQASDLPGCYNQQHANGRGIPANRDRRRRGRGAGLRRAGGSTRVPPCAGLRPCARGRPGRARTLDRAV